MIKIYSILLILFFLIYIPSYAQTYSAGASAEYNLSTDAPGFNLRGYYNIGEAICFGPELTFSFPETIITDAYEEDKFVFEVNINAHYIFEIIEDKLGFYSLFGVNYTTEDVDITDFDTGIISSKTENALGFNVGGGFHLPLDNFQPFIEYHFITGELSESVVSIGVLYTFKGREEESKTHRE